MGNIAGHCFGFHFPAHDPHPTDAEGAAPILVVGATGDPVTPYAWAKSLAAELKSGRLLTLDGYGHGASLRSPSRSTCIDDAVTSYLIDLVVPPDGTTCD